MKKIILSLLFVVSYSYAWDSTAAKYYPLAVGNVRSYHRINTTGAYCIMTVSEYDYITNVIDTTLINGKKYFKISEGGFFRYERIDSTSMNVYRYNGIGSECLLDSLLARKNNTYQSCRSGSDCEHLFQDTTSETFAGQSRKVRLIRGCQLIGQVYKLMYGIGLYYESACEFSGARISLNGCIINGVQYGTIIGIENQTTPSPIYFQLFQNYPNPFNPSTNITFEFSEKGNIQILLYDIAGKEITKLVDEYKLPGRYTIKFSGEGLSSGLYFYQLIHDGKVLDTKKMLLIK